MASIHQARANRTALDWSGSEPPKPEFIGVRVAEPSLETLLDYIDWSPFFHTWELRGRYPAIFEDPEHGAQARELFEDARELLKRIIEEKQFTARGVYAFWPANAAGDDLTPP